MEKTYLIYRVKPSEQTLPIPAGMPLAVIEGGVFRAEVVGYGIARRKPAAHFLDAGATFFGSAGRGIGMLRVRNVLFVK